MKLRIGMLHSSETARNIARNTAVIVFESVIIILLNLLPV